MQLRDTAMLIANSLSVSAAVLSTSQHSINSLSIFGQQCPSSSLSNPSLRHAACAKHIRIVVGAAVGAQLGLADGLALGLPDGLALGAPVGAPVGASVGAGGAGVFD